MSDNPPEDQLPDEDQQQDPEMNDQTRAGMDFLVSIADGRADERIKVFFDANWPTMLDAVADRVVAKLPIDQIAEQAERLFESRWKEESAKRQAAAAGGGGGSNGRPPTESGGAGQGNDDASFLNAVPGGDGEAPAAPAPVVSADRKEAAAVGALRLLEDPLGTIERGANLIFDIMDRRRPQTPQRNDLDVVEDLANRRPYLIDMFASQDPASAPEKLATAMMDGAKSGMSVAEAWGKYMSRGSAGKAPPTWKPPAIEVEAKPVPSADPEPTPDPSPTPVATMGQDRPARRRRRLEDVV